MNALTAARADLQAILTAADLTAVDYLPERVTPPVVLVTAGTPHLEPGDVFGTHLARYDLTAVAMTATNETATDALDGLTVAVLRAMDAAGEWWLDNASQPHMLTANGASYLAQRITFKTRLNLMED